MTAEIKGNVKVLSWKVCLCDNRFIPYRNDGCAAYDLVQEGKDICKCENFVMTETGAYGTYVEFDKFASFNDGRGHFISAEDKYQDSNGTIIVMAHYKVLPTINNDENDKTVKVTANFHYSSNITPESKEVYTRTIISNYKFCGDGNIQEKYEKCDDGLLNGSQGNCNKNCDGISENSSPKTGCGKKEIEKLVEKGFTIKEALELCEKNKTK